MHSRTLERLRELKAANVPAVLVTTIPGGEQELLEFGLAQTVSVYGPEVGKAAAGALRADRSSLLEVDGRQFFLHAINPPLRMAIIGAVHISQALAPMAQLLGYDVTVIDPRGAWATEDRFRGIKLDSEWPDDALEALAPDTRTAIVTLTHDPKLDDPALHVALRSSAFYIGCLGSRRTHAARSERLLEAGFSAAEIARIKGPVGLHIGARSPSEIAASILAEVTARLRLGGDE